MPPWSKKPTPLKVLVCGDAQVGKTCFIDMFLEGKHFIQHPIDDPLTRTLTVENTLTAENKQYIFSLMDLNVTTSVSDEYRVIMDSLIAGTDAIILLYDITSRDSFDRVTNDMYVHIWHARNTVFRKQGDTGKMEGLKKRFGCVVVGNKLDLVVGEGVDQTKRQTKKGEAGDWAESQGFKAFEVSSNDRGQVEEAVKALVASWRKAKWMDDQDDKDSRDAGKGSETKSSVGALLKKAIGGLK